MTGNALQRTPAVALGSALAAVAMLAVLLGPIADAGAAEQSRAGKANGNRNAKKKGKRNVKKPFAKSGPVYACVKVHGRERGLMRVVRHPRVCRRLSGWHRFAWERIGATGPPGSGLPGADGTGGDDGSRGAQGADGQDAQIALLLERIVGLENEVGLLEGLLGGVDVQALSAQVNGLTGDLEGTEGLLSGLTGTVNGLTGDLGILEGELVDLDSTVESACTQLSTLGGQLDNLTTAITGISLVTILEVALNIPGLPVFNDEFECV